MDDGTVKHLWVLREVNRSFLLGLKTALFMMEDWEDISPDKRQSTIDAVKKLIAQSEEAYGTEPTEH
jgi:hypothetical protein